jgi:hypothetical protein
LSTRGSKQVQTAPSETLVGVADLLDDGSPSAATREV